VPIGLFGIADFRRLWVIGLTTFVVRWLELLVYGIFAYRQTESSFIVAMLTLARLLPMGLFGAFLGAWAERVQRRGAMMAIVLALLACSASLAALAWTGHLQVWHLFVAAFINGIGWAADNPVRRMMLGEVVGSAQMSLAMSIDIGTNNASRMLGPTLGGVLLAGLGIGGCFALSVALYAIALHSSLRLAYRNADLPAGSEPVLARVLEGVILAWQDRRLRGIFLVTILYNFFGWPYTSMVPVIAQDHLHLSTEGIGLIASLDGVGAFIGAVLMALLCRPSFFSRAYVGGCAIYFAMVSVFALAPHAVPAGLALLLLGIGGSGYSIMQTTLVYLAAPPEMRSRALGVLSVCIGLGPIGFINLGVMADYFGASVATAAIGLEGLLALALTWPLWRRI
jgi:MFS family permease